jgi:hypothetical protein
MSQFVYISYFDQTQNHIGDVMVNELPSSAVVFFFYKSPVKKS